MAFQHFTGDTQGSYVISKEALKGRFEPDSWKDRFRVEFQTRRKRHTEDWANCAEDLRSLAE